MKSSISIIFQEMIALFILAITFIYSTPQAQAEDGPIFGEDITLADIEYSEAEIQEFHNQLILDKDELIEISKQMNPDTTTENFIPILDQTIQGNSDASYLISLLYLKQIEDQRSAIDKIRMFAFLMHNEAVEGNIADQALIGNILSLNDSALPIKDRKRMFYWLTKGANNGNTSSAMLLGMHYFYDTNYYPNNIRLRGLARTYLKKAAEAGDLTAAYLLSRFYRVIDNNKTESFKWVKVAAEGGNPEAQGQLGLKYALGEGVKTDYRKAYYWVKKGVDANDPISYGIMGTLYEKGWGTKVNHQKALSYYAKSCDLGEDISCEAYNKLYSLLHRPTLEEQHGIYSK